MTKMADRESLLQAVEPNCYGDGNVYRGLRSKDSERKIIYVESQKKEWVGLTEAERLDILDAELTTQSTEHFALAQAIEAKLKEKNA